MRRLALLSVLALAACGRAPEPTGNLAALDAALVDANSSDPALTAALHDQIMVDPALTQSSNANAVRPPTRPDPQSVPLDAGTGGKPVDGAVTLGAMAEQAPGTAGCAAGIRYSAALVDQAPASLPALPRRRGRRGGGQRQQRLFPAHRELRGVGASGPRARLVCGPRTPRRLFGRAERDPGRGPARRCGLRRLRPAARPRRQRRRPDRRG